MILFSSPGVIRMVESRKTRWVWCVARTREIFRNFVENLKDSNLEKCRRKWEVNI
jgi:hypothetical protein